MRIGIDARFFGPKDKGFGRYTENLIKELEKTSAGNAVFFVFLKKQRFDDYIPQNPNFHKVLADYKWYGFKEQIIYPFQLKKYNLDLMHFTHFKVPILYRRKFIVTIHDLILRYFPKNIFKMPAYFLVFKHAIKNSEKIIAVSEHTKKDILKYYDIISDKIKIIYEGVTGEKSQLSNFNFQLNSKSQFSTSTILYVGNDYPHKNLQRLRLACDKLREEGFKINLILITGFISEKELNDLYKSVDLFVFLSLYEGFGLPPLEAMKRGLVVVSSSASCMPEILGDAAIYFDPLNVDDMAEKIKKVLTDNNLRELLIQKGFEQIKKYNWFKMAQETTEIYFNRY